jgi:GNAT superfamily N-acetyltransferase
MPRCGNPTLVHADATGTEPGREVVLRDGARVLIRQLSEADADLLADGFAGLSADSRRMRFLAAKPQLSRAEIRHLTAVDGIEHDAVGAIDLASGEGVAVGRFVRETPGAPTAEVAVTVVDDWQRRGIGSLLLDELIERAVRVGIKTFVATVSAQNRAGQDFLLEGPVPCRQTAMHAAVVELELDLSRRAAPQTVTHPSA